MKAARKIVSILYIACRGAEALTSLLMRLRETRTYLIEVMLA